MSFIQHRLIFMLGMGAVAHSAGIENPIYAALTGGIALSALSKGYVIGANKMAAWGRMNPEQASALLKSTLRGDKINQARHLRTMIRDTDPEVLDQMGGSREEKQEGDVATGYSRRSLLPGF